MASSPTIPVEQEGEETEVSVTDDMETICATAIASPDKESARLGFNAAAVPNPGALHRRIPRRRGVPGLAGRELLAVHRSPKLPEFWLPVVDRTPNFLERIRALSETFSWGADQSCQFVGANAAGHRLF